MRVVGGNVVHDSFNNQTWNMTSSLGATIYPFAGQLVISVSGTNATGTLRTNKHARFVCPNPNWFTAVVRLSDTGSSGNMNRRELGASTSNHTDGLAFALDGSEFGIFVRQTGSAHFIPSSQFNGSAPVVDDNYHIYEIFYTNTAADFMQDGKKLHSIVSEKTALCATMSFGAHVHNYNDGVQLTSSIYATTLAISRVGVQDPEPSTYTINQVPVTGTLKRSTGKLRTVFITRKGTGNSSIDFYDGLTTSSPLIVSIDTANTVGTEFDFDIVFQDALTVASSANPGSIVILFE